VLPSRQRGGVGQSLLEAVKHLAADRRFPLITEYIAGNTRAGSFYRSQGFKDDIVAPIDPDPLKSLWLRYQPS
jgi:GNAT superfamily N-acetyltransferase